LEYTTLSITALVINKGNESLSPKHIFLGQWYCGNIMSVNVPLATVIFLGREYLQLWIMSVNVVSATIENQKMINL